MARRIVTRCSFCDQDMPVNERARVIITWEGTDHVHAKSGRVLHFRHDRSKSALVCRECASHLAELLGIEEPDELDREVEGWWLK